MSEFTKTLVLDAYHYIQDLDNLKSLKAKEYRDMYNISKIEDCQCVAEEVLCGFVDDSLDDQLSFEFINNKLTR